MKETNIQAGPNLLSVVHRFINAAVATLYAFFLIEIYIELSNSWSYIGFSYHPPQLILTLSSLFAVATLSLLLPIRNWTISDFFKWTLHFLLFIPALVIPPQQGSLVDSDLVLLESLIWLSAALLMIFLREGAAVREVVLRKRTLWQFIVLSWLLGNVAIILTYGGSMKLAGIDEVYEQRAAATSLGGAAIGYTMGILGGAINPFMLAAGMRERKFLMIGMAVIGQILIYSTLAGKVVLGSTLLVVAVYFVFHNDKVRFGRMYAGIVIVGALGPWIAASRTINGGLISNFGDLIYMRILALPGVLVGVYTEFFEQYPKTYMSHSIIGAPFSTYPYGDQSVGQVIGAFVTPQIGAVNNYNANFIAADGIAGFGIWGVPIIFLFAGIFISIASKFVGQQQRAMCCATLTPFAASLADSSIFTAILTGGGGAAVLLLYLFRSAEVTDSRR